jgi:hypothetical protein
MAAQCRHHLHHMPGFGGPAFGARVVTQDTGFCLQQKKDGYLSSKKRITAMGGYDVV